MPKVDKAAGGKLANCGVKFVIHAVGPEGTQFTAEQCATRETELRAREVKGS